MDSVLAWLKMNDLEKVNEINILFDLYKNLLTDKQKIIMEKYYSFNLSLKEISEDLDISRSAVLDTIEHATKKLYEFDKKLLLREKKSKIVKTFRELEIPDEIKEKIINEVIYGIWSFNRKIFKSY